MHAEERTARPEAEGGEHGMTESKEALTARELEVLALLAHGKENKEIAAELGLKPTTVRGHLESIYSKLQVTNRVEATVEWLRLFGSPGGQRRRGSSDGGRMSPPSQPRNGYGLGARNGLFLNHWTGSAHRTRRTRRITCMTTRSNRLRGVRACGANTHLRNAR